MTEINALSFLTVVVLQMIGAYVHFRKMKRQKRVLGGFYDYIVADAPGRSIGTGIAMLSAAWLSATSGAADNINPLLVFEMLSNGILHVPSINGIVAALIAGYGFDSMINAGGKP